MSDPSQPPALSAIDSSVREISTLTSLEAIALSDASYLRRLRAHITVKQRQYLKDDLSYSIVAALIVGSIALIFGEVTADSVFWGVLSFLVVFAVMAVKHALNGPSEIDKVLRDQLRVKDKKYDELIRYRIVFEIDEGLTRVRLHTESPTVLRVEADIGLLFVSKDVHQWALKRLDVTPHRLQAGGSVEIYAYRFMRYRHDSGQSIDSAEFERMLVQPGIKTPTYIATAHISFGDEIKKPEDLGDLCFLRMTMEATSNQPPLQGDIFFNWQDALSENGARPTFISGVDTINKITDTRIG